MNKWIDFSESSMFSAVLNDDQCASSASNLYQLYNLTVNRVEVNI